MMINFLTRTVLMTFCCLLNSQFLTGATQEGNPLNFSQEPVMGEVVLDSAFIQFAIDVAFDAETDFTIEDMLESGKIWLSEIKDYSAQLSPMDMNRLDYNMGLAYYQKAVEKGLQKNVQGHLRIRCAIAAMMCGLMLKDVMPELSAEYTEKAKSLCPGIEKLLQLKKDLNHLDRARESQLIKMQLAQGRVADFYRIALSISAMCLFIKGCIFIFSNF